MKPNKKDMLKQFFIQPEGFGSPFIAILIGIDRNRYEFIDLEYESFSISRNEIYSKCDTQKEFEVCI